MVLVFEHNFAQHLLSPAAACRGFRVRFVDQQAKLVGDPLLTLQVIPSSCPPPFPRPIACVSPTLQEPPTKSKATPEGASSPPNHDDATIAAADRDKEQNAGAAPMEVSAVGDDAEPPPDHDEAATAAADKDKERNADEAPMELSAGGDDAEPDVVGEMGIATAAVAAAGGGAVAAADAVDVSSH